MTHGAAPSPHLSPRTGRGLRKGLGLGLALQNGVLNVVALSRLRER